MFSSIFSLILELKNLDLIFSISEIEISKRTLEKIKADLAKIKPDFRQFSQDFFECSSKENFPK